MFFNSLRFILPLLISIVLFGCSTNHTTKRSINASQTYSKKPSIALNEPAKADQNSRAFERETLYSLLLGEFAAIRGKADVALDSYIKEADKTSDLNVQIRTAQLAHYFLQFDTALEFSTRWLEQQPNNYQALSIQLSSLMALGRPLTAIDQAEAFLDAKNNDAPIKSLMVFENIATHAQVFDAKTQQQLIERLEFLASRYPENSSLLNSLSLFYLQNNDLTLAQQRVNQALDADETYLPAILQEIAILQASNSIAAALKKVNHHIKSQPNNIQLLILRARLLTKIDRQEALNAFTQLSKNIPNNLEIQFSRSLLALELGQYQLAESIFQDLLKVGYKPDALHFYLGGIAEEMNSTEKAIGYYRLINNGNLFLAAQTRIAHIFMAEGAIEGTAAHFEQLRQWKPALKSSLFLTEAEIYGFYGYMSQALKTLDNSLEEFPDNFSLRYSRSNFFEKTQQFDKMEADLRHIVDVDPRNATALNALGYLLTIHTERYQEAKELILRALNIAPNNAAIIDSMGWVLFKLGQIDEAVLYLQKAYLQHPDPEIAAHLGEALWVQGNQEKALTIWKQALEKSPNDKIIIETVQRYGVTTFSD